MGRGSLCPWVRTADRLHKAGLVASCPFMLSRQSLVIQPGSIQRLIPPPLGVVSLWVWADLGASS